MRYYYTDPIKAIWMARQFAVNFTCKYLAEGEYPFEQGQFDAGTWGDVINASYQNIYVHPDSCQIFEPQEGDMLKSVDDANVGFYQYERGAKGFPHVIYNRHSNEQLKNLNEYTKIIQRNSKAFFMPEIEIRKVDIEV